jgi:membrane-bound lytic murein transglycosylase D
MLQQGLRLRIPTTATTLVTLKKIEQPRNLAKNDLANQRSTVYHQVKAGETLSRIAAQYQVSVREILQWNTITDQSKVLAGQRITLHPDRPASEATTVLATARKLPVVGKEASAQTVKTRNGKRVAQPVDVLVLNATKKQGPSAPPPGVAASTKQPAAQPFLLVAAGKKQPTSAAQVGAGVKKSALPATVTVAKGKKTAQTWYVVKNGDTLWDIAKRFQVSPQEIKALNNLPNNNLAQGDKLLMKRG